MTEPESPPDDYSPLDAGAARILAALLAEPFPGRDDVARQVAVAKGRVIDDHGCLALSVSDAPPAEVIRRIPIEAEVEDLDGATVHVLLHVVDGYLNTLEIYREDGGPILAPIRAENLRIVLR